MSVKSFIYRVMMGISNFKSRFTENEHFEPKDGLEIETYLETKNRTALHHLIRYYWAIEVLSSTPSISTILDAGCGSGYGSFLIAKAFSNFRVEGFDYDYKAIRLATTKYQLPNLSYFHYDFFSAEQLGATRKWDSIICFDTLEHLINREIVLETIVEQLQEDGLLLLSTPCGHENNVFFPPWPAHKIEYSYKSLYAFLRRYFNEVTGADQETFMKAEIFEKLSDAGVPYDHTMNPVICKNPIRVENPYKKLI